MYNENTLNEATNLCYVLLFKQVKEDNSITLYNLDINNNKTLAIVHIANILNTVSKTEIKVSLPYFKFRKLKKLTKINNLIRVKGAEGVDVMNFIKEFEWRNEQPNIFTDIYLEFYKRS